MQILRGGLPRIDSLAISPDSRYVATTDGRNLCVWDLDGTSVEPLVRRVELAYRPQFVGGGLLFWAGAAGWRVFDIARVRLGPFVPATRVENVFAVSPSGKLAISQEREGGFSCWRLGEGSDEPRKVWSEPRRSFGPGAVVFTADSRSVFVYTYLADPSGIGSTHFWDIYSTTDAGGVVSLDRLDTQAIPTLFTPDGSTLLAEYQTRIHAFDARAGGASRLLVQYPTRRQFRAIAVHPAGATLAAITTDDALSFYDVANGGLRRTYGWKLGKLTHLAFTPDGTRCVVTVAGGKILLFDVE